MDAISVQKSTIVRTMQVAFGAMERFAPTTGARYAERLWCAVPKVRPRPFSRPGERFEVPFDGRPVVAEAWGTGPAVYLLHGWGGWRGQYDGFIQPLVDAGCRVVAFDAPSHGDSAPGGFGARRGLLTDFSGALGAVVDATGPAQAVIGHSLGGAAAALAVLDGLATRRLVTIAAMADPMPYTRDFAQTFGFGERIRTGFLNRLSRRVGRPMSDFDLPLRAAAAPAVPELLVIHDRQDKEVRARDAGLLAGFWTGARLMVTEGLGHRRILRDPGVIAAAVSFARPHAGSNLVDLGEKASL